jgi:hypothetical protein
MLVMGHHPASKVFRWIVISVTASQEPSEGDVQRDGVTIVTLYRGFSANALPGFRSYFRPEPLEQWLPVAVSIRIQATRVQGLG